MESSTCEEQEIVHTQDSAEEAEEDIANKLDNDKDGMTGSNNKDTRNQQNEHEE